MTGGDMLLMLRAAVPLEIERLRDLPADQLVDYAHQAAISVATHGDDLQFGGPHCAATMTALIRGLAAAALTADGGVTWLGAHWCASRGCASIEAHLATHPPSGQPPPTPTRRPVHTVPLTGGQL